MEIRRDSWRRQEQELFRRQLCPSKANLVNGKSAIWPYSKSVTLSTQVDWPNATSCRAAHFYVNTASMLTIISANFALNSANFAFRAKFALGMPNLALGKANFVLTPNLKFRFNQFAQFLRTLIFLNCFYVHFLILERIKLNQDGCFPSQDGCFPAKIGSAPPLNSTNPTFALI